MSLSFFFHQLTKDSAKLQEVREQSLFLGFERFFRRGGGGSNFASQAIVNRLDI